MKKQFILNIHRDASLKVRLEILKKFSKELADAVTETKEAIKNEEAKNPQQINLLDQIAEHDRNKDLRKSN